MALSGRKRSCGGADAVQFAARQRRLEQVGSVHGPVALARADQGVHLVDEEDDLALGGGDLVQHGLQPLLELAAVFSARNQGAHIERQDFLVLQAFRHVAVDDAQGQALDDGGLADAGLADQDGVVLGATGQHLDGAADLLVAADDGVDLAVARGLGQVAGVAFQRVEAVLGAGAVGGLALADFGDGVVQLLGRDPGGFQRLGGGAAFLGDGGQQAFGGDEGVAGLLGGVFGGAEDARGVAVQIELARAALDLRPLLQQPLGDEFDGGRIAARLIDQLAGQSVATGGCGPYDTQGDGRWNPKRSRALGAHADIQNEPSSLLGGQRHRRRAFAARPDGARHVRPAVRARPILGDRHLRLVLRGLRGGVPAVRGGAGGRPDRAAEAGAGRRRAGLPLCLLAGHAVRGGHGHRPDVFRRGRTGAALHRPARGPARHPDGRARGHGHHLYPLGRPRLGHLCRGGPQPGLFRPPQGPAADHALQPLPPAGQAGERVGRRCGRHLRHLRHPVRHRHLPGPGRGADELRSALRLRPSQQCDDAGRADRRGHGSGDDLGPDGRGQGGAATVRAEPGHRRLSDAVRARGGTDAVPAAGLLSAGDGDHLGPGHRPGGGVLRHLGGLRLAGHRHPGFWRGGGHAALAAGLLVRDGGVGRGPAAAGRGAGRPTGGDPGGGPALRGHHDPGLLRPGAADERRPEGRGRRDRGAAAARTAQAHPGPRQPPRHRPPDRPPRRPGAGRGARRRRRRRAGEQRGPERRQRRLAEGRARQRAGLPVSPGRPIQTPARPDRAGSPREPSRAGVAAQRRDRRRHAPARRDRLHPRPDRGGRAGAPAKVAAGGVGSVKSPLTPADAGAQQGEVGRADPHLSARLHPVGSDGGRAHHRARHAEPPRRFRPGRRRPAVLAQQRPDARAGAGPGRLRADRGRLPRGLPLLQSDVRGRGRGDRKGVGPVVGGLRPDPHLRPRGHERERAPGPPSRSGAVRPAARPRRAAPALSGGDDPDRRVDRRGVELGFGGGRGRHLRQRPRLGQVDRRAPERRQAGRRLAPVLRSRRARDVQAEHRRLLVQRADGGPAEPGRGLDLRHGSAGAGLSRRATGHPRRRLARRHLGHGADPRPQDRLLGLHQRRGELPAARPEIRPVGHRHEQGRRRLDRRFQAD
uniref:PE-PGRS family protein n=1 Tax=Parastrongyloides trichosuri TaxID=131310 RepID=A0A0N4ZD53_PARTI